MRCCAHLRWLLPFLAAGLTSPAAAAGWKLVFQDQFDGNALDRNRWATRYIYANETLDHLNDEKEHYRDNDNHRVFDGQLSLIARSVGGGNFESGLIRSRQTFYYGYFEARLFLPKGKGVWPAFWLNPDYDAAGYLTWPPEIDIAEYAMNGIDDKVNMIHSAAIDVVKPTTIKYLYSDPKYSLRWKSYVADGPLNESWHVFGMVWAPDRISVFLDGKRLYTREYKWERKDGVLAGPAHVQLNFAVGGKWAGRYGIEEQYYPQAFKIDYVRVCQFTAGTEGQRTCGGSPVTPDPAAFGYRTAFNDLAKPVVGTARLRKVGSGATVMVPIAIPAGYAGDRVLRVSVTPRNGTGRPLAVATQPLQLAGPAQITPEVSVSRQLGFPPGDYLVTAELMAAAHKPGPMVPTPLVCTGAQPSGKALKCQVGIVALSR